MLLKDLFSVAVIVVASAASIALSNQAAFDAEGPPVDFLLGSFRSSHASDEGRRTQASARQDRTQAVAGDPVAGEEEARVDLRLPAVANGLPDAASLLAGAGAKWSGKSD